MSTRREDTAGRIREVALVLFSEHGYEGTSLRQIAETLGFTKAALYYHYRSKEDILEALLKPIFDEMRHLMDAAPTTVSDPVKLRELLERHTEMLLRHRHVALLLSNDIAIFTKTAIGDRIRAQFDEFQHILVTDDAPLEQRVRMIAAFGALQFAVVSFPDASEDELREPALAAALAVLGQPGGAARE
ncbi:TetR family transcriptional regulator [Herbihabitans rhizosphaerae]|uniref:TetR family transcriptional regulator n=1 Tax=Herbihabitans rhizosphaerae TaxID=1872711 RepID=A0A4Q7KKH3_9PSEU|nr:TetR/AcrR family transcriptional regulator [Herbihabitans rhizosphaerae]RZS34765.1 TetR family transcriptional regulator [Herbihabitans rhizosphaerae]